MNAYTTSNYFIIGIFFGLLHIEFARGQLWCYECNVDINYGPTAECKNPYAAPVAHLQACPLDQPYHCLKSVIFYGNVHVTVRGCVASNRIKKYCDISEASDFPQAKVDCYFCQDDACNRSLMRKIDHFLLLVVMIFVGWTNLVINK